MFQVDDGQFNSFLWYAGIIRATHSMLIFQIYEAGQMFALTYLKLNQSSLFS